MISFIIRRLLISIPVLILSSVLVFLLVANSGDPLGELKGRNPPVPKQVLDLRRHQLNLDKPLPARYWTWVSHFVRGDTFTFAGFLFLSMPVFWLAALLKEFVAIKFNQTFGHRVFYAVGAQTPDLTGSLFQRLADYGGHLVLPTATLAL